MKREVITREESGGLRVSSHLEKKDGIIDIVGNKSGRRRVASGDEVQLHLVVGALIEALESVLAASERTGTNEGEEAVKARARELIEQIRTESS
jgi:uncharacterized protein YbcI